MTALSGQPIDGWCDMVSKYNWCLRLPHADKLIVYSSKPNEAPVWGPVLVTNLCKEII